MLLCPRRATAAARTSSTARAIPGPSTSPRIIVVISWGWRVGRRARCWCGLTRGIVRCSELNHSSATTDELKYRAVRVSRSGRPWTNTYLVSSWAPIAEARGKGCNRQMANLVQDPSKPCGNPPAIDKQNNTGVCLSQGRRGSSQLLSGRKNTRDQRSVYKQIKHPGFGGNQGQPFSSRPHSLSNITPDGPVSPRKPGAKHLSIGKNGSMVRSGAQENPH